MEQSAPPRIQTIQTCLWFDTQGEDAARFYTSIFPNSRIEKISHYAKGMHRPEDMVLTVTFKLDGQDFMVLNGGPDFKFTQAVSLVVNCADQAEIDHYWSKLSEGGKEVQCGWLTDKFGLYWQIVPRRLQELVTDPDPEKTDRVMHALMKMVKLDIAGLEKAYQG